MYKYNKTKSAIIDILIALQRKHGKNYCFPTQIKLLELLATYHGIHIKRRALCYALADLCRDGIISRTRRIFKNKYGSLVFHSTLYFIRRAGYKLLNKFSNTLNRLSDWFIIQRQNQFLRENSPAPAGSAG